MTDDPAVPGGPGPDPTGPDPTAPDPTGPDPSGPDFPGSDPGADDPRPVLVLNGPNLGRLGTREPEIYGATTYAELAALCVAAGRELGLAVTVRQSESEAELLQWLHDAADRATPVVLNAGAWTHTSLAIGDACAMLVAPLIEVHLSNVHQREPFRHHSYVSAHATGVIVGLGVPGYVLALSYLASA